MDTVKAVIDVGTNSIKFHAARKKADGSLETVLDKNDIARLGEGLRETGLISPEALERNALSVAAFAEKAKELGAVPEIVGTMALRTAKNAADFASRVKELTGLDVRIIPGEEEGDPDTEETDYGANIPQAIKQAMLLLIGEWYEQREAAADTKHTIQTIPWGVKQLLAPYREATV